MKNLLTPKKLLLNLGFCLALSANASQAGLVSQLITLPEWIAQPELTFGVNWARYHSNNANLVVDDTETDILHARHSNAKTGWQIGAEVTVFDTIFSPRRFLNRIGVGVNYYEMHGRLKGDVWEDGLSTVNNYDFHAPLLVRQAMFTVKPGLFTYSGVTPYGILGAGWTWNKLSYHEHVVTPGIPVQTAISLRTKWTNHGAWNAGVGIRAKVTCLSSLYVEYLYDDIGRIRPSHRAGGLIQPASVPSFNLHANMLLFGVNIAI